MYASIRLVEIGVPPENMKMRRVPWPKKFGKRCDRDHYTMAFSSLEGRE